MQYAEMAHKIANGSGFIAALDQSGGSTPGALKGFGIDAWQTDTEMFELIHAMRTRIITSPAFIGEHILGAILFEATMHGEADGVSVPQMLIDRGVVPFVKIDKGLMEERDGVQLMRPIPQLDVSLQKAKARGVFGTKERSVIKLANEAGIAAVVAQQFEIGEQVLAADLVPIIEPEIDIKSPERSEADVLLLGLLLEHLDTLACDRKVILKLSLPATPGQFDRLVDHPRVMRVVALSGGFERQDACAELVKNRGIIASFSRALLADLRSQMTVSEFDASLAAAVAEIYAASTCKVV